MLGAIFAGRGIDRHPADGILNFAVDGPLDVLVVMVPALVVMTVGLMIIGMVAMVPPAARLLRRGFDRIRVSRQAAAPREIESLVEFAFSVAAI